MGKDPQTALRLSELASRFQNIADTEIDAATSAKFINSQLKAFGNTSTLQKFTDDFFVQIVNIHIVGIEGASVNVCLFANFSN